MSDDLSFCNRIKEYCPSHVDHQNYVFPWSLGLIEMHATGDFLIIDIDKNQCVETRRFYHIHPTFGRMNLVIGTLARKAVGYVFRANDEAKGSFL